MLTINICKFSGIGGQKYSEYDQSLLSCLRMKIIEYKQGGWTDEYKKCFGE